MKKISLFLVIIIGVFPNKLLAQSNNLFDPVAFYGQTQPDFIMGMPSIETDTLILIFKATNPTILDSITVRIGSTQGANDVKEFTCPITVIGSTNYWMYNGTDCKIWGNSSRLNIPLTSLEKSYTNWISITAIENTGVSSTINLEIQ